MAGLPPAGLRPGRKYSVLVLFLPMLLWGCHKSKPAPGSEDKSAKVTASAPSPAVPSSTASALPDRKDAPSAIKSFWTWVKDSTRHLDQDAKAHFAEDLECYTGDDYKSDPDYGKCEAVVLQQFDAVGATSYNVAWYEADMKARAFTVALKPVEVECEQLGGRKLSEHSTGPEEVLTCEVNALTVRIEQFGPPTPATRIAAYTKEYVARDKAFAKSLEK